MVIGEILSKTDNISYSHKKIGVIGATIMIIGLVIVIFNPDYHMNDYYHSRQGFMIFMSGFVLLWLYLCHVLVSKAPHNIVFDILYKWSRYVTPIYIIQWILIIWCVAIFDMNTSGYLMTIVITVLMVAAVHFINHLWVSQKK